MYLQRSAASHFIEEARSCTGGSTSSPSNNAPTNAGKSPTTGIMSYSADNFARGSGEAIETSNNAASWEKNEKDVPF